MSSSTPAVPTDLPRRSRLRRAAFAVAVLVSLVVPFAVNAAPAQATTIAAYAIPGNAALLDSRTWAERTIAWMVLGMINQERAVNHLPPLAMNFMLIASARKHNLWMARDNAMSHQLPGEPAFTNREQTCGYPWTWAGENIGWNSNVSTAGTLSLESMMYGERPPNDGHRQNILSGHFTEVGVDVYADWYHHKIWLTEDFGRR